MFQENKYKLDWEEYARLARKSAAEGAVLLENKDHALPIKKEERVSVFGRIQFDYYKSGTGSGGLVNTRYVVGILDALKKEEIKLNEKLLHVYEEWLKENPFDKGAGWGLEPWSQAEMSIPDDVLHDAAKESDLALVIIGRTAGEDQDNANKKGSYLLTDLEEEMLSKVCKSFKRTVVILNVGNIIDMSWVKKYEPAAILYAWQGGMEGGNGVTDVLLGKISPSGKLPDTIAYTIEDYPSTEHFGGDYSDVYAEDIYVGYRYFETFAKDKVQYPFGYGLSYTNFELSAVDFVRKQEETIIKAKVKNIGDVVGKEVVQIYVNPPQGVLGKPIKNLVAYEKTRSLEPNEEQEITFTIEDYQLSSYDETGVTGHQSSYVLEEGSYEFYIGNNVRETSEAGSFALPKLVLVEECRQALAPVDPFQRMKAEQKGGSLLPVWENVPLRADSMRERIENDPVKEIAYTGDRGIKLGDVFDKKNTLEEFIAQLSDKELSCLVRGEGMCSSKVTPGTASAFGGLSDSLMEFGIPAGCCADGPSGIRMDCGTEAFSLPNGTLLASTFNKELLEELFTVVGLELRTNHVDTLLGPGMNIHRNPLNGRNFEYFSEDPYLTGTMAAAQLKGMASYGVTGTIKHFAANNQEHNRRLFNAVVSERALREIYLKGFEIAVKQGKAYSIMTTYGAINGIYTASNYDLLTVILRGEWGYEGMVMTDWWADMNEEGENPSTQNTAAMVRGQNDVFMVIENAEENSNHDNLEESLNNKTLRRGVLQRSGMNICRALMKLPCMERSLGRISEEELAVVSKRKEGDSAGFDLTYLDVNDGITIDTAGLDTQKGSSTMYGLTFSIYGTYTLQMRVKSDAKELAQIPVSIFINGVLFETITINGTGGKWIEIEREIGPFFTTNNYIKLYFAQSGMVIENISFELKQKMEKNVF
ncbi:glycoside hydrolase family 3 protein [Konateibacter massiliensis]|uniref:glycoside hydrolase family 3 protein n=1 Tax=Konateibacter massiliensis TaxID=2002841 RepID=UPI000C15BE50|nr:glycoside hydrolase family 3 protein [Konateibacter massiliensis]